MSTSERPATGHPASDPAQWLDRHGDALYRYAFMRTRDQTLSEDLVQEALLAALATVHAFTGVATERTWLIAILKNKMIDHWRRRGRETPLLDEPEDEDVSGSLFDHRGHWAPRPGDWGQPQETLENQQFWRVLEACLKALPARLAEAFLLREIDGLAAEEACKVLGVTSSNLWVTLHRARQRLRLCLEVQWFNREPE